MWYELYRQMATRILFACGLEKKARGRCSYAPESETFWLTGI